MAGLTPFQTVGPYLHLGLRFGLEPMTSSGLTAVGLHGRLLDGAGEGIGDGVLEFWAAVFVAINHTYFVLSEEPGVERRFGESSRTYKANVPRWVPGLIPWAAA